MPIRIDNDLPVKKILEEENIFVMDAERAMSQDIRPLEVVILNLMPLKEDTELQLLRSLANTPLQVNITFIRTGTYEPKNVARKHLERFYTTFDEIKYRRFDGMIITGAPVEKMDFEEVDYWKELTDIMDWSEKYVTSTLHICWGAQAGLYHRYGVKICRRKSQVFISIIRFTRKRRWYVDLMTLFWCRSLVIPVSAKRILRQMTNWKLFPKVM